MKSHKIKVCRNCKSKKFKKLLDLGNHAFSGYFPNKIRNEKKYPLILIRCEICSLVQLSHNFELSKMYGKDYGYRSGLNESMVKHLKNKSKLLKKKYRLENKNLIIDIGANDGTFLHFFNNYKNLIAIDPTISKFKKYYTNKKIIKIEDFFNSSLLTRDLKNKKADLITSLSMFYDLPNPNQFVNTISKILSDKGVWHFEQSYLPEMLKKKSFDTICHEHLEYYDIRVVKNILEKNNLKIIDIVFNDINGGSFCIDAVKNTNNIKYNKNKIKKLIDIENQVYKNYHKKFSDLKKDITKIKTKLKNILKKLNLNNKKVYLYGASTKGNTLLQYFKINEKTVKGAFEINKDKFNCYTPGSNIKIIDEKKMSFIKPDYLLVLPWHFQKFFIKNKKNLNYKNFKYIFPLPKVKIY